MSKPASPSLTAARAWLSQAKRAANRRAQPLSTAHVLLVMLQKDVDVVQALAAHAVDERALLTVLSSLAPERGATLERSLERAARLAERLGQKRVEALHLLVAFTRDRRCNAFAALTTLGVHAVRLGDALLDAYFQSQAVHARSRQAQAVTTTAHKRRPRAPALASAAHKSLKAAASPTLDSERSARAWAMPSRHASPPAAPMGGQARPSQPEAAPQLRADPAMPEPPPRKARLRPPRNRRAAPIEPSASVPCTAVAAPASEAGSTATNDPSTQPSVALDGRRFPLLTSLGRNLSALAATGAIDPVVGREAESEQLLDILARRRANNPVLVGPPGVGKTAVVEGLAHSLAQGGAGVRGLEQTLLIELSVGALLAGTGVRGAVGERLRRLRQELATAPGRVVLFIDEIHTLLAAGESPDDLAQELKAGLARGEFPCIGATTEDEYRRYFERDPALMRRFSPVRITEPDADSATAIVRGILPRYEDYHQVRYAPAALEAAVHLSQRYLVDRHLPDKAIALIDTAGARARRLGQAEVDSNDIATVVASWARIPLARVLHRDQGDVQALLPALQAQVCGQAAALTMLVDTLREAWARRGVQNRPQCVALLAGPAGSGKTHTVEALAALLFAGQRVLRLDMRAFGEAHHATRLLGAPPGYVGHEQGGQLSEVVRREPYTLVVLDHIDAAHPEVRKVLWPIFERGEVMDGRGRVVDFRKATFILTRTEGARGARRPIGFASPTSCRPAATPSTVDAACASPAQAALAHAALDPTLQAQMDHGETEDGVPFRRLCDRVIPFARLDADAVHAICVQQVQAFRTECAQHTGLRLEVAPALIRTWAAAAWSAAPGDGRACHAMVAAHLHAPVLRWISDHPQVELHALRCFVAPEDPTGMQLEPVAAAVPGASAA